MICYTWCGAVRTERRSKPRTTVYVDPIRAKTIEAGLQLQSWRNAAQWPATKRAAHSWLCLPTNTSGVRVNRYEPAMSNNVRLMGARVPNISRGQARDAEDRRRPYVGAGLVLPSKHSRPSHQACLESSARLRGWLYVARRNEHRRGGNYGGGVRHLLGSHTEAIGRRMNER